MCLFGHVLMKNKCNGIKTNVYQIISNPRYAIGCGFLIFSLIYVCVSSPDQTKKIQRPDISYTHSNRAYLKTSFCFFQRLDPEDLQNCCVTWISGYLPCVPIIIIHPPVNFLGDQLLFPSRNDFTSEKCCIDQKIILKICIKIKLSKNEVQGNRADMR